MVLADLSEVWADANVYQSDLRFVKLGMPVELTVSAVPDITFTGQVSFVAPTLDAETLAMLNRAMWPILGQGLPQEKIEVSSLYYDYKFRQLPPYQQQANADIDLRFATLMKDLDLPLRDAHDALNDAVMAALAFIKLRQLRGED